MAAVIDVVLFCLAWNVYFESRGEPSIGQYAVAEVTITRASISGRGLCEEVFLDKQFSWNFEIERPVVTNMKQWALSLKIAGESLMKATTYVHGATHFHALKWKGKPMPKPKWAKALCHTATIGNHVFYKPCMVN